MKIMSLATLHLDNNSRTRLAISSFYFVIGLVFASWASRIPDIKDTLSLSNSELGSALFAIPLGQLFMMVLSGYLVHKFGSRGTLILGTTLYTITLFFISYANSFLSLFVCLFFFGMIANMLNIATNTQACFLEKIYERNIMSSFHGLWSLGGFLGGIIGTCFVQSGMSLSVHYFSILVVCFILIALNFRYLLGNDIMKKEESRKNNISLTHIDKIIIFLGLMGFGGMFCEGTVYDWSSVYFSSVVKPDASFIRAGYVAGMGAMTCGRFVADRFVTKYGAKTVLHVCGSLIVVGLMMVSTLPYLVSATFGFLLVGFGISSTVPICYSIAGKQPTMSPSIAITFVSSISFIGFLIGPPLIGYLSDLTGMRIALASVSLFGLSIVVLCGKVTKMA
nr:MFS transporter [Prevotella sp.]